MSPSHSPNPSTSVAQPDQPRTLGHPEPTASDGPWWDVQGKRRKRSSAEKSPFDPLQQNPRIPRVQWLIVHSMMLNAGSVLNKTEELADLARQKDLDIIGVTEIWLHDGIRDYEICLPGYTLFRQDRHSQKMEGTLSSMLNPISYFSACCSRPRPPLHFK